MLLRIVKTEGFAGVFKGFSANMINTFSQRMSFPSSSSLSASFSLPLTLYPQRFLGLSDTSSTCLCVESKKMTTK